MLNVANAAQPGGGWEHGAGAQEENAFRRSTYNLATSQAHYPIPDKGAIYSPTVMVYRGKEKDGYPFMPEPI